MLRKTISLILAIFLACTAFLPVCAFAAPAGDSDVVRVAWPGVTVMSTIDENGNYAGYDYEYLQKIAQYTGWKYEFITFEDEDLNVRITKSFDMLEKGEVDIVGDVSKNESTEALYDFPTYSYGTAYKTLIVPEESAYYSINDLMQNTIRVAVYKNAVNNKAALQQFCDSNKIRLVMVECEAENDLLQAVSGGSADAVLSNDLSPMDKMRTIVRFAGAQYYLATTKGNTRIINGLNSALFDIHTSSPYFETELYRKYFEEETDRAALSEAENEYVKQSGVLRVLFPPASAPFQYMDGDGALKGVSKSVLDTVSEQTGLTFDYIVPKDHADFQRIVAEGGADLIAGIPYNYQFGNKYDTVFTDPFVTASMTLVALQGAEDKPWDQSVLALPGSSFWPKQSDFKQVDSYDSVPACIDAVLSGKADYTYANIYSIEYYTQNVRKDVVSVSLPGETQGFCIGVVRPADMNLISIINKVVRTIPENETTASLFRHSVQAEPPVTFRSFVEANPVQSVAIIALVFLVIIVLIVAVLHTRLKANKRLRLDNQRYLKLADMANEYLFEYDHEKDTLILSQKCADMLGSERVVTDYSEKIQERFPSSDSRKVFWNLLQDENEKEGEICLKIADGSMRWYSVVKTTVAGDRGTRYVIGKLTDIQKEKQEKEHLLEKSQRDGLTGLYNIESCRDQVADYLQKKPPETTDAFLICDIDRFKEINDTFGHFNGDKVLTETAGLLRSLFRSSDIAARLGGDEFVIFMRDVKNPDTVMEKCAQLCREFRHTLRLDGKELPVTLSVGAALAVGGGHTYEELYRRADAALYVVKDRGRDGFELDRG